jgi:hypothetical protein
MSNKIDLEFNENFKGGRILQTSTGTQIENYEYAYEQYMGSTEMGTGTPIPTGTSVENYGYEQYMGSTEMGMVTPIPTRTSVENYGYEQYMSTPIPTGTPVEKNSDKVRKIAIKLGRVVNINDNNNGDIKYNLDNIRSEIYKMQDKSNDAISILMSIRRNLENQINTIDYVISLLKTI